jgi:hypothetical protein
VLYRSGFIKVCRQMDATQEITPYKWVHPDEER